MSSRMMTGETFYHKELAKFVNNIGYQAMLSCIYTLVNKNDIIIFDTECHACIIDGIRLHVRQHYAFTHNNIEALELHLKRALCNRI